MSQTVIKPKHSGLSAAGYPMTRPRATSFKKEFSITYKNLTATERVILETFFDTYQGDSFNWTHPETGGATYGVAFVDDELEFEWAGPASWATTWM